MGPEIATGTKGGTRNMTGLGQNRDQIYGGTGTGTKDWDQLWSGTGTGTGTMTKNETKTCNKKKKKRNALEIFFS